MRRLLALLSMAALALAAPAVGQASLGSLPAERPESLNLYATGDADGDGLDDLLLTKSWRNETRVLVVSGLDPSHAIWTSRDTRDSWFYPYRDVDGDGLVDLVHVEETANETTPTGSRLVTEWQFMSGADGSELMVLEEVYAHGTDRPAGAGVGTYLTRHTMVDFVGGSLVRLSRIDEGQMATGAFYEPYLTHDADLQVEYLDGRGQPRLTAVIDDPEADAGVAMWAHLDGDGIPDPIVIEEIHVAPNVGLALDRPRLAGVSSEDGSILWRHLPPPPSVMWPFPMAVGDVDGDGSEDLSYYRDLQNAVGRQRTLVLVSGADGTEMGSAELESDPYPWGDADGDGDGEFLLVERDGNSYPSAAVLVDGAFRELWRTPLEGELPHGIAWGSYGQAAAFPDLTGDGVPDVLTVTNVTGTHPIGRVVDGASGDEAWSAELTESSAYAPVTLVGDVTGDGGQDLLLTSRDPWDGSIAEAGDGRASFAVLAGGDGRLVWRQLVREPQDHPLADGTGWMSLRGSGVGDLDGDGLGDLAIEVMESVSEADEGDPLSARYQQWYVFGTKEGEVMAGLSVEDEEGGRLGVDPAPGLPAPDKGPADAEPKRGSPGAPAGLLLAALVGLAVAAARRR